MFENIRKECLGVRVLSANLRYRHRLPHSSPSARGGRNLCPGIQCLPEREFFSVMMADHLDPCTNAGVDRLPWLHLYMDFQDVEFLPATLGCDAAVDADRHGMPPQLIRACGRSSSSKITTLMTCRSISTEDPSWSSRLPQPEYSRRPHPKEQDSCDSIQLKRHRWHRLADKMHGEEPGCRASKEMRGTWVWETGNW
jgi:hypothetical protein